VFSVFLGESCRLKRDRCHQNNPHELSTDLVWFNGKKGTKRGREGSRSSRSAHFPVRDTFTLDRNKFHDMGSFCATSRKEKREWERRKEGERGDDVEGNEREGGVNSIDSLFRFRDRGG